MPTGDGQPIVGSSCDLQVCDWAQSDIEADHRQLPQVSLESRKRIELIARIAEAHLNEDVAGPNRFRVLGLQRSLLGCGRPRRETTARSKGCDGAVPDARSCPRSWVPQRRPVLTPRI